MKYISVDEFISITNGKAYDLDGNGVWCVDAIKEFNVLVYGYADFTCGNNWAYGLWTLYGSNGVEKYFDKYPYSEAKKGDWIIWNWGSQEAPKSHVACFMERVGNGKVKAYGQSQNGIKAFNFANISENGILGVLRPKIYENPEPTPTGYPFEGIVKKGSPLYDENGNKYPNGASTDRDVIVEGELNERYKVYGETFNPHIVYANKNDVIKKGTSYPFQAVIKKGSALYDKDGNKYPNGASVDRQVTVQGEYNGRYQIYGETFNPHVVYCDKDAIK